MGVVKLSTAGIVNYEKYSNFRAGIPLPPTGSFDLLETQVLASSAASVVFDNLDTLAAGYQHLQIRAAHRTNITTASSTSNAGYWMRANSDSGSNYSWHRLEGNGSAVLSSAGTSQTWALVGVSPRAGQTANSFSVTVTDILDPFSSSKNTTFRGLSGVSANSPYVALHSGLWQNTSAITELSIFTDSGGSFVTGSRFSIYGLRTGA